MNNYTLCSRCNEKPAAICLSCLRLDTSESSNADLLKACEGFEFTPDCGGMFCIDEEGCWPQLKDCEHSGYCQWAHKQMKIFEDAVAKATPKKKRGGCNPEK